MSVTSTQPVVLSNALRSEVCPLCGSSRIFSGGPIRYALPLAFGSIPVELGFKPELGRCRTCRSAFTQYAISQEDAERLYREGDSSARWGYRPLEQDKTQEFVSLVNARCHAGMRVLDVGCNDGALLEYVKRLGCHASGVELSLPARRAAQQRGHVVYESLRDAERQGPYDIVFALDVLEHMYDISHFMKSCQSMLSPRGILICLTGDIACLSARLTGSRWWYVSYPEHVRFPSKLFFSRLPNFTLVEVRRTLASKAHEQPFIPALRALFGTIRRRGYRGQPSLGPDHIIAVLEKTETEQVG